MLDSQYIETVLNGKDGFEFQKYCENYLRKKYGGEFQEVAAKGRLGDGGKDGYVCDTKEYFAMSTQSAHIATKIKNDFKSCIDHNLDVKKFIFVTNQQIGPKECDAIDELKMKHPDIEIETISHLDIAKDLINYPQREVLEILGKPVPFFDDKTVYFAECTEKQKTFTLWESIRNSMHIYLATIIFTAVFCISLFYVTTEWVLTICVLVNLGLMSLYIHFNINSIRKYKYATKFYTYCF